MLGTLACFLSSRSVLCSLQIDLGVCDTEKIPINLHVPESGTTQISSHATIELRYGTAAGSAKRNRTASCPEILEQTQGGVSKRVWKKLLVV